MNSIIQCLNCVEELVAKMLKGPQDWGSGAYVTPAFANLLREMWAKPVGGRRVVDPTRFLSQVARHDSRWQDGCQQDSQEFLHSLLEGMQVGGGLQDSVYMLHQHEACSSRLYGVGVLYALSKE